MRFTESLPQGYHARDSGTRFVIRHSLDASVGTPEPDHLMATARLSITGAIASQALQAGPCIVSSNGDDVVQPQSNRGALGRSDLVGMT